MKKTLSETGGKHFEEETGVMGILAESRRKYRERAVQLLKELEEEKQVRQTKLIEMRESRRPDTTGFMKVNYPVENKIQESSNIWKWFKPVPETVKLASAESSRKKLIGGIFEKGFEEVKSLDHLFGQKDWLSDPEKEVLWGQRRRGELSSTGTERSRKDVGEENFSTRWLQTVKEQSEEIPTLLRWFPFAQKTEGQSPAMMREWNNKELSTKKEAGLEPNSAWYRVVRPLVPTPEETPKSALSFFSRGAIFHKDYGALFGFRNIRSDFGQAEGDLAKSVSRLGKRYNEETRIEMDGLKEEIKNIKINGDKIMRSLQDLREQMKISDTASEEGKPRPAAIEEDWGEDDLRTAVRKGMESS